MIYWEEYKKLKTIAEQAISTGESADSDVVLIILEYQQTVMTKDEAIEDIINVLSGGKHYEED